MSEFPVTILLVEDQASDADLVIRALKRSGVTARIDRVHDGVEALDYLLAAAARGRAALPHLVLLDYKLPKLNGVEVLTRVRADARLRTLVLVMLTSSEEPRDLADAYAAGVNSYVVKPVAFDAFLDTLERLAHYWLTVNQQPHLE